MKKINKQEKLWRLIITVCILTPALFSCSEKTLEPISPSKGKPGTITVTQVTPTPGGAVISYRIPQSEDILAVKVVYTLTNGEKRESVTSFYESALLLEGYNDTKEHEVQVYTINRAQESSDPANVKFTPLESPIAKTIRSLNIVPDFGGANFSWKNEDQTALTFEFMTTDSLGNMRTVNILTSKTDSMGISLRGYAPVARKFAAIIRDNFHNVSDTLYPEDKFLTPIFERKLDKTTMQVRILAGDATYDNWEGRNAFIIDDDINSIGHSFTNTFPYATFTLDLGQVTQLSRFLYWQRGAVSETAGGGYLYSNMNPRIFEVWGTSYTGDSPSGDWANWTKLLTCEIIKPSGTSPGTLSQDDITAAREGHEFSFPVTQQPLRYIRFKFIETWKTDSRNFMYLAEVSPFGMYIE
jgi:hypothetical protein